MKPNLFKSRKFWIAVVDALISIATMAVALYLSPDNAKFVLGVIASLQPVIYAVINGIATEDAARIAANGAG
jgi:hypothetical protein